MVWFSRGIFGLIGFVIVACVLPALIIDTFNAVPIWFRILMVLAALLWLAQKFKKLMK